MSLPSVILKLPKNFRLKGLTLLSFLLVIIIFYYSLEYILKSDYYTTQFKLIVILLYTLTSVVLFLYLKEGYDEVKRSISYEFIELYQDDILKYLTKNEKDYILRLLIFSTQASLAYAESHKEIYEAIYPLLHYLKYKDIYPINCKNKS